MRAEEFAALVEQAIEVACSPLVKRIAVLEVKAAQLPRDGRDGLPGPPGPPGEKALDGKDGRDGAPGRDGTLESLKAVQDPDNPRRVTLCFKDDTPIEGGTLTFDYPRFKDLQKLPWDPAVTYGPNDLVQWKGNGWIATAETTGEKPGSPGSSSWTLFIRAGRDGERGTKGEDGKHGRDGSYIQRDMR
jgi:hypothetical protein